MVGIALGVITTAICLKIVAALLPGLEIEDWSAAIGLALVMSLLGTAIGVVIASLLGPSLGPTLWVLALIAGFVVNVLVLAIATMVVPGVEVRGAATVVLAALLLAALQWGIGFALQLAREGARAYAV